MRPQTHQANKGSLLYTYVTCALAKKAALGHTAKTTADGQLVSTFYKCHCKWWQYVENCWSQWTYRKRMSKRSFKFKLAWKSGPVRRRDEDKPRLGVTAIQLSRRGNARNSASTANKPISTVLSTVLSAPLVSQLHWGHSYRAVFVEW